VFAGHFPDGLEHRQVFAMKAVHVLVVFDVKLVHLMHTTSLGQFALLAPNRTGPQRLGAAGARMAGADSLDSLAAGPLRRTRLLKPVEAPELLHLPDRNNVGMRIQHHIEEGRSAMAQAGYVENLHVSSFPSANTN